MQLTQAEDYETITGENRKDGKAGVQEPPDDKGTEGVEE